MIIACPACETRYELPDGAIKAGGRTVRCAKCRHSWFQEPEGLEEEPDTAFDELEPAAEQPEPQAEEPEPLVDPEPEPELIEPEPVEAYADEPRPRGRFRLWAWAVLVFLGLAGITAAAAAYWGLPDWVPFDRPAFAAAQHGLELDFPPEQQERRQLPNGTEFFGASGTITNVASTEQRVPPILIVLRDARDRIVYSWEVEPPRSRLGAGESMRVREAITDVPRSARVAEIGWKPA